MSVRAYVIFYEDNALIVDDPHARVPSNVKFGKSAFYSEGICQLNVANEPSVGVVIDNLLPILQRSRTQYKKIQKIVVHYKDESKKLYSNKQGDLSVKLKDVNRIAALCTKC